MEDLIVLSIRGKDNAFLLSGIFGFAGADAADLVDSLTAYRTQPVGIESGSGAITTHRLAANDNLIGLWFSVFISSNGKDCNRPPSLRY